MTDNRNVVFFDIDGVLNLAAYNRERNDKDGNIDVSRQEEISAWLNAHPHTENYVILDDAFGGWGELEPHLVRTNSRIGRGLEDRHVDAAIHILKRM